VDAARFSARQAAVAGAVQRAWSAYKQHAWGYDELKPLSRRGANWLNEGSVGLGVTLVDSLDLLWLVGLLDEFEEAKDWVKHELDVTINANVNVFETTIRVLGGLLAAHFVSTHEAAFAAPSSSLAPSSLALSSALSSVFLDKAAVLGRTLAQALDSPSGVPHSDVNLATGKASP
jgi:mannosyl-oligosaccharide alpha-1,2-mannosidase